MFDDDARSAASRRFDTRATIPLPSHRRCDALFEVELMRLRRPLEPSSIYIRLHTLYISGQNTQHALLLDCPRECWIMRTSNDFVQVGWMWCCVLCVCVMTPRRVIIVQFPDSSGCAGQMVTTHTYSQQTHSKQCICAEWQYILVACIYVCVSKGKGISARWTYSQLDAVCVYIYGT